MSTLVRYIFLLWICLAAQTADAQAWERITELPNTAFTALEVIDGTIYAASGTKLYISTDKGLNWEESVFADQEDMWATCFKKFNGRIYAGTTEGIFSAEIGMIHSLWNHELQTENTTSFTERDNVLYASLDVFGILKLNGTGWVPNSTGLPAYAMSVTEVLSTPAGLLAIAGANGTFFRYDFTQGTWMEEFYSDDTVAEMQMDDIANVGNTLYVSRTNTVYRSDDLGETWVQDKEGLLPGHTRMLYAAADTLYSISIIDDSITRFNNRDAEAAGEGWSADAGLMPLHTFAIREVDGVLFVATAEGLYIPEGALAAPDFAKNALTLYPNPSSGEFQLQSDAVIDSVNVYDLTGRLVLSNQDDMGIEAFTLQNKGIYIAVIGSGGTTTTQKVVVR